MFDPYFYKFRVSFANLLIAVFGLVCMVTLAVTIVYIIQGERDSAKKMLKWVVVSAVGFALFEVIKNL